MSNEVKLEDIQAIIGTLPKYVNSEIREMRGVLERIDYGEAQRAIDILKEMQMVRWIPVTKMADLIDREKLLKALGKICDQHCPGLPASMRDLLCGYCLLADAMTVVENFPHEESKPGRWEQISTEYRVDFRCSSCRRFKFHNGQMRQKYKYCPGCGVRMEEPNDE